MNVKRLKRSLRRIVGPKALLDDPGSLAAYSYDSSLQSATPDLVLFPQTTEQVAQMVRLLNSHDVPYVARGAGTNLSGGSIPLKGGAVIALARMKRILSIDPENFCARVGPGLTNLALQEALAERGFFFAPDPASQKVSTLGGNVAENSGGPHCLKYGVTTNHILGAKLVTAEGEIIGLGGECLDSPDCDLLGLLVGSEGTLGIVTEIACRITPLPEAVKTMLAIFDSTERAGRTVSEIMAAGIMPATLEMMDNMIIRAVEQSLHAGYPTDAAAVLIIEIDGRREGLDETAAEIERICRDNAAREVRVARDERERAQLWAGRRGAFGAVMRIFPNYLVSDGTVPRTRLPEVLRRVAEIGRKYELEVGNVFHAGDGNLHPLLFFDSQDKEQVERVHRAGEEILDACIEIGGTITGEHGIGTEKIKAMPRFFGPDEIELMRNIKAALDPAGLCNPGKVLPELESEADRSEAAARRDSPANNDASGTNVESTASMESFLGAPIYLPADAAELAALVRRLKEEKKSFAPVGARTLSPNLPMRRTPDAFIGTERLAAIVEHDADNLTATVGAGIPLGELQKSLAGAGQFLPLDGLPRGTAGGAVASALAGPRRHAYGAVRDLILGLEFVGADGRIFRAGGKTVKNVAGYDFGKLLIGSWGTLGIITEITFRLLPLPKACGAVVAGFENAREAYAATVEIVQSRLGPALAALLSAEASVQSESELGIPLPSDIHALALGAEGVASSVERQLAEFERVCRDRGGAVLGRVDGKRYGGLVAGINALCRTAHGSEPPIGVCVNVPCRETTGVFEMIREIGSAHEADCRTVAHLAGGTVYSQLSIAEDDAAVIAERMAASLGGRFPRSNITVFSRPGNVASQIQFIIGNHSALPWRRAIKRCFDPKGLLNPGIPEW